MKKIFCVTASLLILSSGAAFANHGKAGLWNISTTMNMAAAMPPEVLAQMKAAGVSMPSGQTFNTQICMTQADVEMDKLPPTNRDGENCDTHVISQTGSSISAETVCKGRMQGTGKFQISYSGAEHYTGNYSFQGVMEGHPSSMSSTMKGDWVKADCGSVKPYTAPASAGK